MALPVTAGSPRARHLLSPRVCPGNERRAVRKCRIGRQADDPAGGRWPIAGGSRPSGDRPPDACSRPGRDAGRRDRGIPRTSEASSGPGEMREPLACAETGRMSAVRRRGTSCDERGPALPDRRDAPTPGACRTGRTSAVGRPERRVGRARDSDHGTRPGERVPSGHMGTAHARRIGPRRSPAPPPRQPRRRPGVSAQAHVRAPAPPGGRDAAPSAHAVGGMSADGRLWERVSRARAGGHGNRCGDRVPGRRGDGSG